MLLGLSQKQIQEWNSSLHTYEKAKRTKRPYGRVQPQQRKSTHDIIQKQMKFNPILQSFRDERELSKTIEHQELQKVSNQIKHIKNNYKYTTDYDIINFSDSIALPSPLKGQSMSVDSRKKEHKDPSFQDYNIINNSAYREGYLQKIGYKPVKNYSRNIQAKNDRIFNVVTGKYNQNHEEQHSKQIQQSKADALKRQKDLRVYNSVNGRFYDEDLQKHYQTLQREQQKIKVQKAKDQIPPSYIYRESLILNDNPEATEAIKALDQKKEMSKQRYKMRYILDEQYRSRNDYLTDKMEQEAFKRVHNGRILQEKGREFNILNSQRYANNRAEQLFGKEITGAPYELRSVASPIKQHGF